MGSTGRGVTSSSGFSTTNHCELYLYTYMNLRRESCRQSAPKMNVANSFVIHVEYCYSVMCPISKGSSLPGFIGDI